MSHKNTRTLLRSNSAYSVGRSAIDVLLILELTGSVIILGLSFWLAEARWVEHSAVLVGVVVVNAFAAVALREIAQSIFDMADASMRSTKIASDEL